jgi:opacity protein-like surface antigen
MKKYITLLTLFFALTAALAAADFSLSAGGGGYIGGLFTRYTLTADGKIEGEPVGVNAAQEMNQFNFGGFLFVDGTWAVFSVGIQGGLNNYNEEMITTSPSIDDLTTTFQGEGSETMLSLALLGKYPFTLNNRFTLFPLLGLEYQIALVQTREPEGGLKRYDRTDGIRESNADGDPYPLSVWNSWSVVIGAGMDYRVFSSLFVRAELLYGFRLQTPYETDALKKVKKLANAPNPKLSGLTSGPALRIAAGWRFF